MRKKSRWIIITLLCLLLIGCAKKPESYEFDFDEKFIRQGNHVSADLGENLKLDAEIVNEPKERKQSVLNCTREEMDDPDVVQRILFSEGQVEKQDTMDGGVVYIKTVSENEQSFCKIFPEATMINFRDAHYVNNFYSDVLYYIKKKIDLSEYYYPEISPDTEGQELEGYSMEKAQEDMYRLLTEIGIDIPNEPYGSYCLPGEYLRSTQDYLNADGSLKERAESQNISYPEFTAEDGCYVFLWKELLNDIPVVSGNYPTNGYSTNGGEFNCRGDINSGRLIFSVMGLNGPLYIESKGAQFKVDSEEKEEELKDFSEVIAKVGEYYNQYLLSEQHTVYRISYCYVPVGEISRENEISFQMIPSWVFEVQYQKEGQSLNTDVIYVNAITGELIP